MIPKQRNLLYLRRNAHVPFDRTTIYFLAGSGMREHFVFLEADSFKLDRFDKLKSGRALS